MVRAGSQLDEGELLSLLKQRFGEDLVRRGLDLATGAIRLEKDHRLTDPGRGIFRDYGVASISRTESKVEFDLNALSPRCLSCGLAAGTICRHTIATLIAVNRQGFLPDDGIRRMVESSYGVAERGSDVARRVCPNCRKPLDIPSQIVCPKCGRGVCAECFRKEDRMCTKCYDMIVLGKKPKSGFVDVMKTLFRMK